MTLKNNSNTGWKHYVCDISGGSSEFKGFSEFKASKGKKNRYDEVIQGKRLIF